MFVRFVIFSSFPQQIVNMMKKPNKLIIFPEKIAIKLLQYVQTIFILINPL